MSGSYQLSCVIEIPIHKQIDVHLHLLKRDLLLLYIWNVNTLVRINQNVTEQSDKVIYIRLYLDHNHV